MEATSRPQKVPVYIEEEMRESFMAYAMSVIISRALPDVRDGLKPVHRRVLYAMYDAGNTSDKPYKKSARLVGDIMGKYHPHGDTAIYDTIVRMAQDFNLRYPLVDGQGNFGSIDGDNPAAMRYTEIRMTPLAEEMLADIEKETVDFIANYDDSLKEPAVLPARIPNLLINGSAGIAVGMATNIPPHNLTEVVDGLIGLIENPDITIRQLMRHIPGPDFPTAGFIHGKEPIVQAYHEGKGIVQMMTGGLRLLARFDLVGRLHLEDRRLGRLGGLRRRLNRIWLRGAQAARRGVYGAGREGEGGGDQNVRAHVSAPLLFVCGRTVPQSRRL